MATPATPDHRFYEPTPFQRLLYTHAANACGDACIAVSLAGSLFFQKPGEGARGSVLLYLLLTMAPFAIVAPFMGPLLDRIQGGRRLFVFFSCVGRGMLALAMAQYITKPSPEGLLIYPLAFGVLVLSKTYSVARSALVPALVDDEDELVKANSRLALISVIGGAAGGAPAFGAQELFGADVSLIVATLVFAVAAVLAVRIPRTTMVLGEQEKQLEKDELHQPSILIAGSAMAVLRSAVGFFVFFAAFRFKDDVVALVAVGAMALVGGFIGNLLAPVLREQKVREERILLSALLAAASAVLVGGLMRGTFGFIVAGLMIAIGAAAGRIGFDSLLQRDGPDAARGRAFAWFETRFQLAWVVGALFGLLPVGESVGLVGLGAVLVFGGVSYLAALRAARSRPPRSKLRPEAVDRVMTRFYNRARDELRERYRHSRAGRRRDAAARRRVVRGDQRHEPPRPDRGPPPRRRPAPTPGDGDHDAFPGGS